MNNAVIYRDSGERFFNNGNSIFLNLFSESPEPHLHVHDFIEISYVASGSGIHILGDSKYEVCKGDLFLINYDIPHEFRSFASPAAPPLQVYNCVFKPDFIDVNLNDYKDFSDVIHYLSFRSVFSLGSDTMDDLKILGGENSAIEAMYKKMLVEFTNQEDGYIEMLRAYLMELLITIFRSLKKSDKTNNRTMSHHAKLIEQSIRHLKANYTISTKLNELASQSFLSPTYFCKLFKEHTGMTVSEYVQRLRIEEACNLLTHTDNKIIVVAEQVGYKDIKHFNEVFKKLTGQTPSVYKKLHER
ncbi:AraC family transcriptional regulator [Paenibacillus sp. HW567]|uniref:AraC family transcriptional regulator n=1 Tax=Paenibacillus sp. HW567 TaxID=1034769 RepID=UPI00039F28D2|nr:AraC family transcriptional regulator [Paenibacillus sp. HW567]